MGKKRSTRAANANSAQPENLFSIMRGGEEISLAQSADTFVVKRKQAGGAAELSAVMRSPNSFPGLQLDAARSPRGLELYRIDPAAQGSAMDVLRSNSSDVAWCGHTFHMPGDPEGLVIPLDGIYVELVPGADADAVNALLDEHGLEYVPDAGGNPNACVMRLTEASTQNPLKIANALNAADVVELAEPDLAAFGQLFLHRPTDTLFPLQWHLENRGGMAMTSGADVSAPAAWDISRGTRNITVAVIDDGFDLQHPDFRSAGKIRSPRDFGQNDLDPSPVGAGDNHGTACAGVAVADENGSGVVGLAPECGLMPIRWSGSVSDDDIRAQFDHAWQSGADVISCSWGVTASFFSLSTSMIASIRRAATQGRGGKGCVIVFAAGNANHDIDNPPGGTRDGFAIHPDVIAVSASNSRDQRSDYSNFGDRIWICAPSSGAGGVGIVTTDRSGASGYQSGDYTTVARFGGTSSATPLVAGLCGLILSVNPDLTAVDVRGILRTTSDKIDPANGNYDPNGHSRIYGYGRVNARRAVEEANRRRTGEIVERVVQFDSRPKLTIPDFQTAGISDSIQVSRSETVQSVAVDVQITHPFRGDLRVTLVGPDGTTVPLFGRSTPTSDGTDDLVVRFTAETVPALTQFRDRSATGAWTLQAADLARSDVGTLDSWSLILGLSAQTDEFTATPGLRIPDKNATGITSDINVTKGGTLRDIVVTVDISHKFRGDLKVSLKTPTGIVVTLRNINPNESTIDLRQSFTPADTPGLQQLVTQTININGLWQLEVSDNMSGDEGKLNAWSLRPVV